MKNLVKIIALVLFISTTSFANGDPQNANERTTFSIGMYAAKSTETLKLNIKKIKGVTVVVKIVNANDKVIFTEFLSKRTEIKKFDFKIKNLPEGNYKVVISDGTESITKNINIKPLPTTIESKRNIVLN